MNSQNIKTSYDMFILNDKQSRTCENKVYSLKFVALLLTTIITACIQQFENEKLGKIKQSYTYVSYTTAFVISCFSTKIGHRTLYLISYSSLAVFFVLLNHPKWLQEYEIIRLILLTLRNIFFIQAKIQIYGTWPKQFGRIIVEFYAYSRYYAILLRFASWILAFISFRDIILYVIYGIDFVLLLLCLNNFKSPETDSVFKDFLRMFYSKKVNNFIFKPLIFTILILFSDLLSKLLKSKIIQEAKLEDVIDKHGIFDLIATLVIIFLYIIFQIKFKNFGYQPTFIIFASLIILFFVSFIMEILILLKYFRIYIDLILYIFVIVVFVAQVMWSIPQYQQIFLHIGIRNIDFASSYQSLVFAIIYLINDPILKEKEYIPNNLNTIIPSLCLIIFIIALIFYQYLGFRKYFKQSNRSYVEELAFSIEVN